jgi:hypothetical protein
MQENNGSHLETIEINATDYPYTSETITLAKLKQIAGIPADHNVYIEVPEPSDDPEFKSGETANVHQHRKFYSVSPAITGGRE